VNVPDTGTVRVTSQALGENQLPLANFTVNENHPNELIGLGNGLTITSPLTLTGISGTACNFLVVGQSPPEEQ